MYGLEAGIDLKLGSFFTAVSNQPRDGALRHPKGLKLPISLNAESITYEQFLESSQLGPRGCRIERPVT